MNRCILVREWTVTTHPDSYLTLALFTCYLLTYYAPAPRVGGIKQWCMSDVCLSRISGLNREQRGLGRHWGSPRHTWLGHHFQRPKGQRSICRGGGILWRPPALLRICIQCSWLGNRMVIWPVVVLRNMWLQRPNYNIVNLSVCLLQLSGEEMFFISVHHNSES